MKKILFAVSFFISSSVFAGNITILAPATSAAGVTSISTTSLAGSPITGAVQLLPGSNITMTQSGQGITFGATGGTSISDAFATDVGYWSPFGTGETGSAITLSSNTLYGFEMPPSPLATSTAAVVIWGGSGNGQLSIWNASMTTLLSSSSITAACGGCAAVITFPIPFQFQINTTYVLGITDDASGGIGFTTTTDNLSLLNAVARPRIFTCANNTTWSGGIPTNPSTCGVRTASSNGHGQPVMAFFH